VHSPAFGFDLPMLSPIFPMRIVETTPDYSSI
jgi:hypothetical protein